MFWGNLNSSLEQTSPSLLLKKGFPVAQERERAPWWSSWRQARAQGHSLPGGRVVDFSPLAHSTAKLLLKPNSPRTTGVAIRTFQSPESPGPLKCAHSVSLET